MKIKSFIGAVAFALCANSAIAQLNVPFNPDGYFCATQGSVLVRNATAWSCLLPGTNGQVLQSGGAGANASWLTVTGTGTVTSIGLSAPSIFSVTGSPITGAGTLALGFTSQTANTIFASPSGSAGTPTFRALTALDVPLLGAAQMPDFTGDVTKPSASTVTTIATGAVTGAKIASATVANSNLATMPANTLKANATGATAAPADVSLSAIIDSAIGTAQGSVLYRNASIWTAIPPGTAGQFLQTSGAASNPVWAGVSGALGGTVTSISAGANLTASANPITTTGTITGESYGRNLLENGDFLLSQRYGGAYQLIPAGDFYYNDRWLFNSSVLNKVSTQNNGCGSAVVGFSTRQCAVNPGSSYTPAVGESFSFGQRVEGFSIAPLLWGTASAKSLTLSFWMRAYSAGTYSGAIRNDTNTRSYPFSFSYTAGVQKITVSIPGDTSGTWNTGAGTGLYLSFDLGSGATFRGTAGAWATGNFVGVTGANMVVDTISNYIGITGVQLEVGSVATSFEYLPMSTKLARAQRYYQGGQLTSSVYAPNAAYNVIISSNSAVTMRATPSGAIGAQSNGGVCNNTTTAITALGTGGVQLTNSSASGAGSCSLNITYALDAEL